MKARSLAPRMLALFLALLIAQPVWLWAAVHTPELPNPGEVSLTREQQQQLGLKAMSQVYQQMPVLPDSSPVTQYVQQLGKKLEKVIPQQYTWPYQFHVIEQKEINAFALPGGPIFINVGTITAADNEAELAGVMAHEMSHVYMQHSAKQMKQNVGPSILAGLGQILGSMVGGVGGAIASIGGQMAGGMWSMKYSRGDEAQADAVGAIILWKAGYNPKAMAEFFQKLEKEAGPGGPQFLSDHPNPGNRVQAVDNEIKDWPPKPYQDNSQAFVAARQQATKVKAYTAQQIEQGAKNGTWARQNQKVGAVPKAVPVSSTSPPAGEGRATPGNDSLAGLTYEQIKPSGSYSQYQQNGISISYPNNWQASSSQNGVTIAPQAAVSQAGVAYGVVMGTAQMPSGTSLDQAAQMLAQEMEQSNPGLQASGSAKSVTVNGMQGRSQMLMGNSPVQQNGKPLPEQDWLVAVAGPNSQLVYAVFVSPQRDFGRLKPTYEHMLHTLQLQ
ncbi:MAG: M48 family metalloprotease [Chlamydiota bacterium]